MVAPADVGGISKEGTKEIHMFLVFTMRAKIWGNCDAVGIWNRLLQRQNNVTWEDRCGQLNWYIGPSKAIRARKTILSLNVSLRKDLLTVGKDCLKRYW